MTSLLLVAAKQQPGELVTEKDGSADAADRQASDAEAAKPLPAETQLPTQPGLAALCSMGLLYNHLLPNQQHLCAVCQP